MGDETVLLRAVTQQGVVVGRVAYTPERAAATATEAPSLVGAKATRATFRRWIAACLSGRPWEILSLECGEQRFQVVPLSCASVSTEALARAYQAIWANAEIYRKAFSIEEARALVGQLKSGLALLEADGAVCGLAGGFGVEQSDDATLAQLVDDPATAAYLAEWGLVDSSQSSAYRGLGLGSLLLTLYLRGLVASGHSEVVLVTAETGYGGSARNPARPLYEAHGFRICRDATGEPVRRSVTQLRLDGRVGTHTSVYYRATAAELRDVLRPDGGPIAGVRFER